MKPKCYKYTDICIELTEKRRKENGALHKMEVISLQVQSNKCGIYHF